MSSRNGAVISNYVEGPPVAQWYVQQTGLILSEPLLAIGEVKHDELIAAVIFNHYSGTNADVHIFCPHRMTLANIRIVFDVGFNRLKVVRLSSITKRTNRTMLKLLPRLGFQYEATLRHWFGPTRADDAVINRIERDQAMKWMKNGRSVSSSGT